MIRKRDDSRKSWEHQLSDYTVSDVDKDVFKAYLERAKKVGRISFESDDSETVLKKLELSKGEVLLNAGAALFVDCGINELALAKFATNERLTFTDLKRYTGSILDLMSRAEQYVIDSMDWRAEFRGKQRQEIPEAPVDAVHEAIVNAFAHRDIENGQSVEIIIFKNRIEVTSPGHFPDGKTPDMFIHSNEPPIRRNRLITRTLYYSKDMESFATGLKRIQDSCDKAGVKVDYKADQNNFVVIFYRHCGKGWGWSGDNTFNVSDSIENVTENNFPDSISGLSKKADVLISNYSNIKRKTSLIILELLRDDSSITVDQISEKAGISRRTVLRYLKEFQKAGIVKREGSDTSGKWVIK